MDRPVVRSLRVLSPKQLSKSQRKPSSRVLGGKPRNPQKPEERVLKLKDMKDNVPTRQKHQKRVLEPKEQVVSCRPKKRRTVAKLLDVPREAVGSLAQKKELSLLERKSISVEARDQYKMYFRRFVDFCRDNGSPLPQSPEVLDAMLTDYMDLLFLDNRGAHEGEKTVAAVEFNIISVKGKLVRARRALRGWRKEMPPQSRLPLPKVAMFGIAMNLLAAGSREMALMVMVAFFLYLRPGEAADIKASSVVGPVRSAGLQFQFVRLVVREQEGGRPDKVGVYDNCIPFDLPSIQWIGRELLALAKTKKNKNSLVFAFTMEEFRKQFTKAAHHLNLQNLHPYQLRHGGATEDLSSRARDHASVKSRGRWHTDQSVRRYGKIGRVQQLLNKLSAKDLQFCRWSMKNMERVFQGSQVAKHSNL